MPFYVQALLTALLTLTVSQVGIYVGRRIRSTVTDSARSQLMGMQASLLGLLALLLGFSFALAETRYDVRRHLVIEEANAIGTARLRAGAVPDDPGYAIQSLLQEYVTTRLAAYRAADAAGVRRALDESARLQREAWSRASALARRDPHSLPASLLLQSLNDVIDLNAERIAAARNHIPTIVLVMLIVVALVTMGWVGACVGVNHGRGTPTVLVMSLLISMVVTVIVDLDQPRRGLIRVSQASLIDLESSGE